MREANATTVKLSLRSRNYVNVAKLARSLTTMGGGHIRAAGAKILSPLQEVMEQLPVAITQAIETEA